MPEHPDKERDFLLSEYPNEKNISLYEHVGFRVIDQLTLPDSDILHTAMLRYPYRQYDERGFNGGGDVRVSPVDVSLLKTQISMSDFIGRHTD